ncbi:hypothetical protein N865_00665 [Intrasporangium oryzae NRRL B-24470]|uniref:Methyltransferase n=1 Tax=Intrasporangium oryzae NRRL B-24470 TaxID=1386089 RepID=W9GCC9_9MICO|nr:class I SAM-dependent methyltransferase [Intrasporangium oryzae]EWT02887.1 hypothetical protein N865_00665 [Intrasporangium oryzae NRRL B-24470]
MSEPTHPEGTPSRGAAPSSAGGFSSGDGLTFEQAWQAAGTVPGWLTEAQARVLWHETRRAGRRAHVVEIGSHRGRSTVVIASALTQGHLTAIDAFVAGERYGGPATRAVLEDNLVQAGVRDRVEIIADRSGHVRRRWGEAIDLLWVDGKHDYWTCSDDLRWATFLPSGGRVLVHDAFSSLGVTLALLVHVLPSSQLRYLGRTGSLAVLEVGTPTRQDRARFARQLPWWVRNVGIKVLLRLRLRGLARRFGHTDRCDPY